MLQKTHRNVGFILTEISNTVIIYYQVRRSMYKFFQETTKWSDSTPNHTYVMTPDKSKAIGYIKAGTKSVFKFSQPMRIDTRHRTFKVLPDDAFAMTAEIDPAVKTREVIGSKGDVYYITDDGNQITCSCSGFKFRGKCKHIVGA